MLHKIGQRTMIQILKGFQIEMDDSSDKEDGNEVLTECKDAVDDNDSDSEGDSDSDSD